MKQLILTCNTCWKIMIKEEVGGGGIFWLCKMALETITTPSWVLLLHQCLLTNIKHLNTSPKIIFLADDQQKNMWVTHIWSGSIHSHRQSWSLKSKHAIPNTTCFPFVHIASSLWVTRRTDKTEWFLSYRSGRKAYVCMGWDFFLYERDMYVFLVFVCVCGGGWVVTSFCQLISDCKD